MSTRCKHISFKGLIRTIIGLFVTYHGITAAYKIYNIRNLMPKLPLATVVTEVELCCLLLVGAAAFIGSIIAFTWLLGGYD